VEFRSRGTRQRPTASSPGVVDAVDEADARRPVVSRTSESFVEPSAACGVCSSAQLQLAVFSQQLVSLPRCGSVVVEGAPKRWRRKIQSPYQAHGTACSRALRGSDSRRGGGGHPLTFPDLYVGIGACQREKRRPCARRSRVHRLPAAGVALRKTWSMPTFIGGTVVAGVL